ncbi:MAG: SpoIVB peptidase [Oscillospiraceae bacterium]|nr:SpoIVB peptidase [Oscillospiraceae bacterium]
MIRRFFAAVLVLAAVPGLCVCAGAREFLVPVGRVVGLSLAEGSVTVAAYDDLLGAGAREAGIRIGDDIVSVDGNTIDSARELQDALTRSSGTVELVLDRRGTEHRLTIAPQITAEGPRLGVYVREGVTGIGTVTWYDPEEGTFGALGHGVSDSRGRLCRMERGSVFDATVSGVRRGRAGTPGQLRGDVDSTRPIGSLEENTVFGVFGTGPRFTGTPMATAEAEEVRTGPASILSNISGSHVGLYQVEILKISDPETSNGRDLLIQVTDPVLLEQTGGIVAGMSGSPIIQDGKLVGAVTHVLVNSPDTGYGIFIENMLEAAA